MGLAKTITASASERLNALLRVAVREREDELSELPDTLPTAVLVDLLSHRLSAQQSVLERIFTEVEVERRAELALDAHARFPVGE